jgi:hypothetical protein
MLKNYEIAKESSDARRVATVASLYFATAFRFRSERHIGRRTEPALHETTTLSETTTPTSSSATIRAGAICGMGYQIGRGHANSGSITNPTDARDQTRGSARPLLFQCFSAFGKGLLTTLRMVIP